MNSRNLNVLVAEHLLHLLVTQNLQLSAMAQQVGQMCHKPLVVTHNLNVMNHLVHIVLHHFQHHPIQMVHCARISESLGRLPSAQPDASVRTQFEILATGFGVEQISRQKFVPTTRLLGQIYPRLLVTTDQLHIIESRVSGLPFSLDRGLHIYLPWLFPPVRVPLTNNPLPISIPCPWPSTAISIWIFAVAIHHSHWILASCAVFPRQLENMNCRRSNVNVTGCGPLQPVLERSCPSPFSENRHWTPQCHRDRRTANQ